MISAHEWFRLSDYLSLLQTALAPYRYAYGNPEMTNLYGKERPDVRQVMK